MKNFSNIADELLKGKTCIKKYCEQIVVSRFKSETFRELTGLEPAITIVFYPFRIVEVQGVATVNNILFLLDSCILRNVLLKEEEDELMIRFNVT